LSKDDYTDLTFKTMNYLKIAWRNLWRNKRRTLITTASILFAVFFAIFMRSFQLGFYDHMIRNVVESYSGFIQVQHSSYQDDPSLENTFFSNDSLIGIIENMDGVKGVVPRVEMFALASSGNQTKGVAVLGIDPERERNLSDPELFLVKYRISSDVIERLKQNSLFSGEMKDKLKLIAGESYSGIGAIARDLGIDEKEHAELLKMIASESNFPGQYLAGRSDEGVLIADKLSKYLKLSVGDTLILMGQDYYGSSSAGLFPVRGILKIPSPDLDNKLVYISIESAQKFAELGGRITSLAINLEDNSDENMNAFQAELSGRLNKPDIAVRNWKEFNEVLKQQIDSDSQSGQAFLALLYFIIFFGIFGTVLMMVHERHREFGVLVSIGMRKSKLARTFIYEMFLMGLMGVISGIIISLPFLYYFHNNPMQLTGDMANVMEEMGWEAVMPLAWIDVYILWQGMIVALMVVLACLYPLHKVLRLKEIDALRA